MTQHANAVIDAFDGVTRLARLLEAPPSTVHSWRTIGIPPSRMAHIRLLALQEKIELPAQDEAA